MEKWKEELIELKTKGNKSWSELVYYFKPNFTELNDMQIQNKIRGFYRRYKKNTEPIRESVSNEKMVQIKQNEKGEKTFESCIELKQGEELTAEKVMKIHNIDSSKWKISSFTSNFWQSQVKGGTKIDLWQSKITVKPLKNNEITFEDIDDYFSKKDFDKKTYLKPFKYDNNGEILEIALTDPHTGLLSWREETGSDYDLNIVKQRVEQSMKDIVDRCKNKKLKKIIFVTLGDVLHIDNDKNMTTAGTLQQCDGRIAKIYNKAIDMIINCIDCLFELKVPIEYIYTCGNHDRNTGYFLAKSLELAYRNETNIKFNISPNPQKAIVIGNSLIGFCHGDMPKKNLGEWLQKTYRKEYGITKFAEVHCGHLHSESTKENCGVLIKHLPTVCESSYWEHQQGYYSNKGIMCFLWNEKSGLRETWYNYI